MDTPSTGAQGCKLADEKTFRSLLDDFASESSIHGIKCFTDAGRSKVGRFLWFVLVFGMATFLFYFLADFKYKHDEYPVVSKLSILQKSKLPFPAVTICNKGVYSLKNFNLTESLAYYMGQTGEQKYLFQETINWSEAEYSLLAQENMSVWHDKASYKLNDLFPVPYFRWNRMWLATYDELVKTETDIGRCFTFNADGSRSANYAGSLSGLDLTIDIDETNYPPGFTLSSGLYVLLHEPGQMSVGGSGEIFAAPGTETYIAVKQVQYEMLPKPYKSTDGEYCLDTNVPEYVNPLQYHSEYTLENCWREYFAEETHKKCGCCRAGQQDFWKIPSCNRKQMLECYIPTRDELWVKSLGLEIQAPSCPKRCKYTVYEASISTARFPSASTIKSYLTTSQPLYNTTEGLRNLMTLNVYYNSMDVQRIEYEAKYQWDSIIVSLGGFMGLFVGASLLSVIEIVELLISIIVYVSKRSPSKTVTKTGPRSTE